MKRLVIQIRKFSMEADRLERRLVETPEEGDLIPGTGGLRKTRLKSSSSGKSGGFRVCYCDLEEKKRLYLIYPKNVKEDLSMEERKLLKGLVERLKRE